VVDISMIPRPESQPERVSEKTASIWISASMLRAIVIRTASAKATLLSTRKPGAIRSDNGPEFIARAVRKWLAARKVGSLYIAPGSPWENEYSESFNSRMKAEFADLEMFGSLLEAKVLGAEYKTYWNQERLHSGIGYQTPAEFAAELGPDSATLRPPQVRSPHQPTLISTGT